MGKEELELELEEGSGRDERREAAIASTLSLRLQQNPAGVTSNQLAKFQELHRRRLKIKSKTKSNTPKKSQDGSSNYQHEDTNPKDSADEGASMAIGNSSFVNVKDHNNINTSPVEQENVAANATLKKRRKLHWGLDTKERWERKANM